MLDGIINFRANVVSETVTLPVLTRRDIKSGDSGASGEIYVDMGSISSSQFSDIGSITTPVMFELRVDNQDAEKVHISFNGISSEVINGVLGTTNPAIGIQLHDESGNVLLLNELCEYAVYPGPNVLRFSASLIATRNDVLPGNLGAIAVFTLTCQ